jgi:hypothetical protein
MHPSQSVDNGPTIRRTNWVVSIALLALIPLAMFGPEWKRSPDFSSLDVLGAITLAALLATPFAVAGFASRSQVNPLSLIAFFGIGLSGWLFAAGSYKFYEMVFTQYRPDDFDTFLCCTPPLALLNLLYLGSRAIEEHLSRK